MSVARSGFDSGAHDEESTWIDKFMEHREQIQYFLQYHIAWRVVWSSPIDDMLPYDVRHGLVDTGGTTAVIDEDDWVLLLPLRRITRRHFVIN